MNSLQSAVAALEREEMHPLDNVIWNALSTRQAEFAESAEQARRFTPEVSPLAGLREPTAQGYESLWDLLPQEETVGLFLDQAYEPRAGWKYLVGAPLVQMVCDNGSDAGEKTSSTSSSTSLVELGDADSREMIELTALTKPGPFGKRTHELGTYLGIRREGKLVAMAGERLKVPGYTEVSAVCTHPDHLGNGYAQALMSAVMRGIRERGETPFLHVRGDNTRAVKVYEKLGFKTRKRGYFAVIRKV